MTIPVGELKGIKADVATKLRDQGIKNSEQYLTAAKNPAARKELATKLGIDVKDVLELANRADLTRIKGVAGVFSDLLENAGVDTVKELAARVPENLAAKLAEINAAKKISTRTPTADMVKDWVTEAKSMPKILEY